MLIRLFQYQDFIINIYFFFKAYDQPDVYETFELPEDDQQLDYAEEVRFICLCLCDTVIHRKVGCFTRYSVIVYFYDIY